MIDLQTKTIRQNGQVYPITEFAVFWHNVHGFHETIEAAILETPEYPVEMLRPTPVAIHRGKHPHEDCGIFIWEPFLR